MNELELTTRLLIVLGVLGLTVGPAAFAEVAETIWQPTESRIVYEGNPDIDPGSQERYNVIPCVVRLLDGSFVALVEPTAEPVFIRSMDGGETWSEPYTGTLPKGAGAARTLGVRRDGRLMAVVSKASDNLQTPALKQSTVKLPDGRELEAYEGYRGAGVMRLVYSSDQGKTWTLGNIVDYSPMVWAWAWTGGRLLELDDGTLVLPVAGYLSEQDLDGIWLSSGVVRSTDNGATWTLSVVGRANPSDWLIFSEPAVAKLDDGTLVAMMRTEDRVTKGKPGDPQGGRWGLYRASSRDGGQTWSSPTKTLPGTHCSLVQLSDGVLLCGYHRALRRGGKKLPPTPPRLALSADGGGIWYANMPWLNGEPEGNWWGWYTSVEVVDDDTAVALIKEAPAPNIIRACLLHRQP